MSKISAYLLQSFVVFVESENIIKASIELEISQPALSNQLKQLEELLPHPLFLMKGRKKVLTSYGLDLYEKIKDRFKNLNELVLESNKKYESLENVTLQISGRSEILARITSKIHFNGNLIFTSLSGENAVDELLNHRADIVISTVKPDSSWVFFKTLFEDQFQILLPSRKKKAREVSKALLSELADAPYLSYEKTNTLKNRLYSFYDMNSKRPSFRTIQDWKNIIQLVEQSQGWTICPTSFSFDENKCDSILIPTKVLPRNIFYMLYSQENMSMPWFKPLLEEIRLSFVSST